MTSGSHSRCPFVAGGMITDPRFFVGRTEQLNSIIRLMTNDQPTSINVVGRSRIGKSSLLYNFFQTYELRVQGYGRNPNDYVAIYLSLQDARCHKQTDFYQSIADRLLQRPSVQANQALTAPLTKSPLNSQTFADAMDEWKKQKVLPVLCLDKFERLFRDRQEFDDKFYDSLRSRINDNVIMLVVASSKNLDVYRSKHKLTSDFFNLGHILLLGELTEAEALDLVRLPEKNVTGATAALTIERQKLALQWGGRSPYLLQLAGHCLWDAQQQGRPDAWAQKHFEQQAQRVRRPFDTRRWWLPLRWVFYDMPVRLGRMAKIIGGNVDDVSNWIIGLVILIVILLILLRVVPWEQVKDLLQKALGG